MNMRYALHEGLLWIRISKYASFNISKPDSSHPFQLVSNIFVRHNEVCHPTFWFCSKRTLHISLIYSTLTPVSFLKITWLYLFLESFIQVIPKSSPMTFFLVAESLLQAPLNIPKLLLVLWSNLGQAKYQAGWGRNDILSSIPASKDWPIELLKCFQWNGTQRGFEDSSRVHIARNVDWNMTVLSSSSRTNSIVKPSVQWVFLRSERPVILILLYFPGATSSLIDNHSINNILPLIGPQCKSSSMYTKLHGRALHYTQVNCTVLELWNH